MMARNVISARILVLGLAAATVGGVACTRSNGGVAADDPESFIAELCTDVAPCCTHLDKQTGACAAVVARVAKLGTYDPTKASACLSELDAARSHSDFCVTLSAKVIG